MRHDSPTLSSQRALFRRPLLLAVVVVALSACGDDDDAPAGDPASETPTPAGDPTGTTDSPTPAAPPRSPSADPASGAEPQGVDVQVRSVQLYHPAPRRAPMPPLVADTRNEQDWVRDDGFQIAMQVEVRNTTEDRLFMPPTFDADVAITGARGQARCRPHTQDGAVTYGERMSDGPGNVWREDADDDERYFRPGERVRFTMRARCGPLAILDIQPQTIEGQFFVIAASPFEMGPPARVPVPISLPGAAMIMQRVTLPDGSTGYASGNWVTYADDGETERDHLASWGINAHTAERADLPTEIPSVTVRRNEWSLVSTEITMAHYTDAPVETKGNRLVRVVATISIDSASIESRLEADVTAARERLTAARATLESARSALIVARNGRDPAATAAAESTVESAEGEVESAEDGVSGAERARDRGLASERSEMARYLDCSAMALATNVRNVDARNRRDARAACGSLANGGSATVTWEFEVGRYEIPVALAFKLAREDRFVPVASAPLTVFDIR